MGSRSRVSNTVSPHDTGSLVSSNVAPGACRGVASHQYWFRTQAPPAANREGGHHASNRHQNDRNVNAANRHGRELWSASTGCCSTVSPPPLFWRRPCRCMSIAWGRCLPRAPMPGCGWSRSGGRSARRSARRLRDYLAATWPEFDWNAAYQEFHESYRRPRPGREERGAGAALDALRLCVAAAQAAVLYRALASCADEPALRALVRRAACDHGGYFEFSAPCSSAASARSGWAWLRAGAHCAQPVALRAISMRVRRSSRSGVIGDGAPTVPALDYSEFRARMVPLIQRHAGWGASSACCSGRGSRASAARPHRSFPKNTRNAACSSRRSRLPPSGIDRRGGRIAPRAVNPLHCSLRNRNS